MEIAFQWVSDILFSSHRYYRYKRSVSLSLLEKYSTINKSEKSMVFANTYVFTRVMRGTSLANNNISS